MFVRTGWKLNPRWRADLAQAWRIVRERARQHRCGRRSVSEVAQRAHAREVAERAAFRDAEIERESGDW